ncbi:MAG: thioredoxin domain-containing protein [Deltaproteobacteria bacterium]|nr:thioredoxin domain-containing protein [Deltaproteobacteria bacterium]
MNQTKKTNISYPIQLISCLAGAALSIYLLIQHTRLTTGIQDGASFCAMGRFADCDAVNVSSYAEVFGLPTSLFGAIFYFFIFMLGSVAPPSDKNFRLTQNLAAWLVLPALVYDLYLFGIQLFVLKTFCLFCVLTYVASILVLTTIVQMNGVVGALATRIKASFQWPPWQVPRLSPNVAWSASLAMVFFVTSVLLLPQAIRLKAHTYAFVNNAIEQFFNQWKETPTKNIEWKEEDGTLGNPSSKVRIVEFSDFECPHCQKAAFTLKTALKAIQDKIFFVFKHYPLDSSCNPSITYQVHPNACRLARLATCANRKGRFWEFHDFIFSSSDASRLASDFDALTKNLGFLFSTDEISRCLMDEKSLSHISDNIRQGDSLNIKGTPAVFINGKPVTIPITVETIRRLVEIEEKN